MPHGFGRKTCRRLTVKRCQTFPAGYPAVNQKNRIWKSNEIHGCFLFGQTFAFMVHMVGFPKFAIAEKRRTLEGLDGIDDWRRNFCCMPIIDDFATKECFFTYAASICKLVTHTTHKYNIYIYMYPNPSDWLVKPDNIGVTGVTTIARKGHDWGR